MSCEHQYVSTTKRRAVTVQGVISVLMVLVGVVTLLLSPVFGILLLIAGVLVGMVGRSKSVIVCAKCGAEAPHQPS